MGNSRCVPPGEHNIVALRRRKPVVEFAIKDFVVRCPQWQCSNSHLCVRFRRCIERIEGEATNSGELFLADTTRSLLSVYYSLSHLLCAEDEPPPDCVTATTRRSTFASTCSM